MIKNIITKAISPKKSVLSLKTCLFSSVIWFFILMDFCECNPQFQMLAAIQQNNQTYCSYLPLLSQCQYNNQDIIQGQLKVTPLNAIYLFTQLQYSYQQAFWTPVKNGLSLSILLEQEKQQQKSIIIDGTVYNGFVYYNSEVKNFNRQIILYQISSSKILTFFYCLSNISISTMTPSVQVVSEIQINLCAASQQILNNCENSDVSITFMGNSSYFFVCLGSGSAFIFTDNPQCPDEDIIMNFDNTSGCFDDINGVVGNQNNLIPPSSYSNNQNSGFSWNIAIFCQNFDNQTNQNSTFLLNINPINGSFDYTSFVEEESEISLLIDRIWGRAQQKQFPKWLQIIKNLNTTLMNNLTIPGEIISVFVTDIGNIYIESLMPQSGINYLLIYEQDDGQLIANVTYRGRIVYYGFNGVFIFNQVEKLFYKIDVVRPIYLINQQNMNDTGQQFSKINLQLQCNKSNVNLEYDVLWTSDIYPSAYILPLFSNETNSSNSFSNKATILLDELYSDTPIFNFQVQKYFAIFGPDFEINVNTSTNISTVVIDSSTILVSSKTIDLVYAEVKSGFFLKIIVAFSEGIYNYDTSSNRLNPIVNNPCGFTNIKSAQRINDNQYLITNTDGRKCICTSVLSSCKISTQSDLYSKTLSKNSRSPKTPYSAKTAYLESMPPDFNNILNTGKELQNVEIKKNLYGLLHQNLLVSILVNNSILIIDLTDHNKVVSMIDNECPQTNQTYGSLYFRQFYDPFLLIFCSESDKIVEYIIRKGKFVYERDIPIYGFQTRKSDTQFFIGFNYAFLAVDPTQLEYPENPNCCVLRLDPCQYTVSVIQQIIQANHVLGVTNINTIDIALFNQTVQDNQTTSLIRVYFGNTWVSLNQTFFPNQTSNSTVSEDIQLIFKSEYYNFAAQYTLSVSFNFSSIDIEIDDPNDKNVIDLDLQYDTPSHTPTLYKNLKYNLTDFCGPIFDSLFLYTPQNNISQLEVKQLDILTQTKAIGRIGINFIQIINPQVFAIPNFTLNDLMIFVTESSMIIYDKQFDGIGMYFIEELFLPEKSCIYEVFKIINSTTATFISTCSGISSNFLIPLVTLNYDPVEGEVKSQFDWTVSALTLRQTFTIVRENQSSIWIGIKQGPMRSITGKLVICQNSSCQPLYISSKSQFLMNYAAYSFEDFYIIITIDYNFLTIFLNPTFNLTKNSQGKQSVIPYNFILNYTQYLSESFCSTLKIIYSNNTNGFLVISCSVYYYYVYADYSQKTLQILIKFERYSQCSFEDLFKTQVVLGEQLTNGAPTIDILYAVCSQNSDILKLQTFQTINSSLPTIFTGYLQIFTLSGPTCSTGTFSPIKIIPLSSAMQYNLFNSYKIGNMYKFIYSSIDGFLIDNLVTSQPRLEVIYTPLNKVYDFPEIVFMAFNPYYSYVQDLPTTALYQNDPSGMTIFLFVVFCIISLITVICMIGSQIHSSQRNKIMAMRDSTFSVSAQNQPEIQDFQTFKPFRERMRTDTMKIYESQNSPEKKKTRVSEIQLFFWKK